HYLFLSFPTRRSSDLSLDPDFQLHVLMGEFHTEEERYAEAIKEYQTALVKRPDATGIHYAIGVAYWVQHQKESAKNEFLLALKEDRKSTPLHSSHVSI